MRCLNEAQAHGRRVLVRVDFNLPMKDGKPSDETRLRAALPNIQALRRAGAKIILISHFDRPRGQRIESLSLRPVAEAFSGVLGAPVSFATDCVGPAAASAVAKLGPGEVLLLENLRFHFGEEANDPTFAAALATNGDLYVDDAFSATHRAHASNAAITRLLPSFAGEALCAELAALETALGSPQRPVTGIVGGSKVSTKLELLRNLVTRLDTLAIGGGMANTFLAALGWGVGASLCESAWTGTAEEILAEASEKGCEILLPTDVAVAKVEPAGTPAQIRGFGEVEADERILDAGPQSVARLAAALDRSASLIWNGPLGVFETPPFDQATNAIARHAAKLVTAGKLVAVAGGGDTVAALHHAGVVKDFTFVSTAGGAFLEWMEGKTLPGIAALQA